MPTYSFRCKACGHTFDEFTSISGQDKVVCPKCADKVERVYHGKCLVGRTSSGGSGCSGKCGGCAGCSH